MWTQNLGFVIFGGSPRPIEFIGSSTETGAASFKYNFGSSDIAGAGAGDTLILAVSNDNTVSTAPDAAETGWTQIFNDTGFDSTSAAGLWIKTLTDSDVSVLAAQTTSAVAALILLRGAAYVSHSNSAINTKTPPAVSMNPGDWSMVIGFYQDDETNSLNVPSGYGNEVEAASIDPGSYTSGICIGLKAITAAGTETPGSFGGSVAAADMMRATTVRFRAAY